MKSKQKNRVFYDFKKLAKVVMDRNDQIQCIAIGTVALDRWKKDHPLKLTFMKGDDRPVENQMFGVPVLWVQNSNEAMIKYKDKP